MLISIICGVYNAQGSIRKLLDTLLIQSYHEIEIIMIVNGVIDGTLDIVQEYIKYEDRIVIYKTKDKLGAGGARAKGMELAHGEYLAIVDCDDYVGVDYIKSMVKGIEKAFKPDVILTGFQRVSLNGKIDYVRKFGTPQEALCQSVAPWAKMYRKDFLEKNQIFFRNIPFGEDILFTMEIIMARPTLCLINCADYFWVNRPNSTSHTEIRGFPEKNINISTQYIDEILDKYNVSKVEAAYYIYKYIIWYLLQSGRNVGIKRMNTEYFRAISYIDKKIPQWWSGLGKYIYYLNEERKIVRIVLWISLLLKEIHLDKIFFSLYSMLPMDIFWPNL